MGKVLWPFDLSLARPVSLAATVFDLRVIGGGLILLGAVGLFVIGFRKKNLPVAVGAALFLPAILAHSNLVPIAYGFKEMDFPFFERYLYIPLAGLLMVMGGLIPRGRGRIGIAFPLMVALGLCLFLGKATRQRACIWHDNTRLFMASLEAYPESPTLSFNLGQAFFDDGRLMEAQAAFHRASFLDPDMAMARVHEAVVLSDLGRFDEAEAMLLEVIRKHPGNGQALEAMGFIYAQASQWGKALEYYARAVLEMKGAKPTIDSRDEAARRLKAETEALYVDRKDYPAVLARADLALEWLPDAAWAHEARGLSLFELGEEEAAIRAMEKAVALDENQSALAMSKLVMIYRREGRTGEAEDLARKLQKILERLPPPESFPKRQR
jgi:tetratricopeptide (TPR) repeat protein